jgi:hypothetical protein
MNISIAEIGDVEQHQLASLGVVTVSRESNGCHKILHDVRQVASTLPEAILVDVKGEIISLGENGAGLRGGIEEMLSNSDGWYVGPKE